MAENPQQAAPVTILLVVHDFFARSSDELTLEKGDRIELIERDDDFGDGWYLGKHMINGKTGLFPQVYTTPAPKGITSPVAPRHALIATTQPQSNAQPLRSASTPNSITATAPQRSPNQNSIDASQFRNRTSKTPQTLSPPSSATFDNAVLNETLSVIDEHITDMRAPNSARTASEGQARPRGPRANPNPYEAEYRLSYIHGHETDEEESRVHTNAEVSKWTPERVAEYLEDAGVEKHHCDVFREQEISGEVILTMEQSAIFIKEFDLGSVGRRLKTWNKIKALQDEVKAAAAPPSLHRSNSDYSTNNDDVADLADHKLRSSSAAQLASSQYLSPTDYANEMRHRHQGPDRNMSVPILSAAPPGRAAEDRHYADRNYSQDSTQRRESFHRPSAASVRQINHSRRPSSIDSKASMPEIHSAHNSSAHGRKVSLDRLWSMGTGHGHTAERRASRSSAHQGHGHTQSGSSLHFSPQGSHDPSPALGPSPETDSPDYDSSLETSIRSRHRFLPKRLAASVPHSRTPSGNERDRDQATAGAELLSPTSMPASATIPPGDTSRNNRSSGPTVPPRIVPGKTLDGLGSPIVTKLEYGPSSPGLQGSDASSNHSPAGTHGFSHVFHKSSRTTGLRSASDATLLDRKPQHATNVTSPLQSPVRTGSTTPSTETKKSFEQAKSDNRDSTGSSQNATNPAATDMSAPKSRPARSKRNTSAYTRGLERKPPVEQMVGCDYSGWMKKRSANIMGSWKPRLFVLRGRRLSYYYSEDDIEEKGLIDISGHRVLPADDEKITGLHAQITGAKSSPSVSESSPKITTTAAVDLATKTIGDEDDNEEGLFIFKLVPPRQGMSKAVNFTKPAVHYFAVGSRKEGRLWMAALMRATIDYDASGAVTTSYNQETISLSKARARRERPPALREISKTSSSNGSASASVGAGSSGNDQQQQQRSAPAGPSSSTPTKKDFAHQLPLPTRASGLGIVGARDSTTSGTGTEDSSATDHRKESIEIEHGAFSFDSLSDSLKNVIPTSS